MEVLYIYVFIYLLISSIFPQIVVIFLYHPLSTALYGIPQRAAGVLRIIPGYLLGGGDDQVDVMYCGDEMVQMKDKFEGGVIDPSGNIYCIPLRSKTLMKVVPTIAKQSM